MNWFTISLLPPMIWALSNHFDKYLLNKFFKNIGGGPLIILTSLTALITLPLILLFSSAEISMNAPAILALIGLGLLGMGGGLLYIYAMSKDDPSVVIPLFQMIPVFNYFLGLIFLKETLSTVQLIGSVLVIGGAIFLTTEQEGRKFKIKAGIFWVMALNCILHSFFDLSFKYIAKSENLWGANFWVYFGMALFGIAILIFSKDWRNKFFSIFKYNRTKIISLGLISEGGSIVANLIFNYALLLMPIALVSVVSNGLQPFFVLLFGIVLTVIFPEICHEKLTTRNLAPKIAFIAIIFIGTYLLNIK
jgi:drug/metabolite transporter (DMT)-like permease